MGAGGRGARGRDWPAGGPGAAMPEAPASRLGSHCAPAVREERAGRAWRWVGVGG